LDRKISTEAIAPPRYFFAGWEIKRKYTATELRSADVFRLEVTSVFEPPGEECGTVYDESTACPKCGAGATQVSDLRLDLRKAPRTKDIARTIAGEIIISQRTAELIVDNGFEGVELRPVQHKARYEDDPIDLNETAIGREILQRAEAAGVPQPSAGFWIWLNRSENLPLFEQAQAEYAAMRYEKSHQHRKPTPVWYEIARAGTVEIVPPTRTGIDPFDDDSKGRYSCCRGDTIGLNLISELWVSRQDFENETCDIAVTKQHVGVRRGLLRPERMLLISPRAWRVLDDNGIKGFRVEVAHLK
jgi:hypothetical protein